MMIVPLQVKLTQITPFTMYTMQIAETANPVNWYLISGEGDCWEGDCGVVDCGEADCGEGEWIPSERGVNSILITILRF